MVLLILYCEKTTMRIVSYSRHTFVTIEITIKYNDRYRAILVFRFGHGRGVISGSRHTRAACPGARNRSTH